MNSFKALSYDGFHAFFYKQYWDIIGDDVWQLVHLAFATSGFDPSLAEMLLVLIPKIDNPNHLKNFRPISLCNVIYKIITKVLVNRIWPFLSRLIGTLQGSFSPGKGMSDNIIVFEEIFYWIHKSSTK